MTIPVAPHMGLVTALRNLRPGGSITEFSEALADCGEHLTDAERVAAITMSEEEHQRTMEVF